MNHATCTNILVFIHNYSIIVGDVICVVHNMHVFILFQFLTAILTCFRYGEALTDFRKKQQKKFFIIAAVYSSISFFMVTYMGATYW